MKHFFSAFLLLLSCSIVAQSGNVHGKVMAGDETLAFAVVRIQGSTSGVTTDANGNIHWHGLAFGNYILVAEFTGYTPQERSIQLSAEQADLEVNFNLKPNEQLLGQVVVSGTRTFKRQSDSPVMVNVMDKKSLDMVQACSLSEGLRFQPGLRVETDCQTCNYTQLRMNGLGGSYSQILINGRPIFSPLTGLYGLEQIPTTMIDRIEVVRGGGSALYGSSAIGGTVNVVTTVPTTNAVSLSQIYQSINSGANEFITNGYATVLSPSQKAGISLFLHQRNRETYDHNADNFSELPELRNSSFGTNAFWMPSDLEKLEFSFSSLNEYRYGGEMVDGPAHLAQQSEERTHHVLMSSVDYQINSPDRSRSFIAYAGGQLTTRDHFTGIQPDTEEELQDYLINPPYGTSKTSTLQGGIQMNQRIKSLPGDMVLTAGVEYLYDDVLDVIETYNYQIDQTTRNAGLFLQSDWEFHEKWNLLAGVRGDAHNLIDGMVFSPRVSMMYKPVLGTQFRASWGKGFRAPQAFDTDLHIAFAGGGISRISLADNLEQERSDSFTLSINSDHATDDWVAGFTLEGFYTRLNDAFYLHALGEDEFGKRFEKRNGSGAKVRGGTLEVRANYKKQAQIEGGWTLQRSDFNNAVTNIDGLEPRSNFLRTPNSYGYANLLLMPNSRLTSTIGAVYTGRMDIAHFAGAPEQTEDAYVVSPAFLEWNFRVNYEFGSEDMEGGISLFGGVKNLTNAYQGDFDSGKDRDSNYVYGPGLPRTFFTGLKWKIG